MNHKKRGLVLEGGAMRGLFTCGVIDVFMEEGIPFDGAVGVSAGAAFGCNIKSGQIGRPRRYNKTYCNDKRYVSFNNLLRTGDLYDAEFCYHQVPEVLDPFDSDAFIANPMDFYVVATDVETGKPFYHKCYDGLGVDVDWIRASASMPLVSQPVKIGKRSFLDGGISDPIPLQFMEHKGYEKNVVVLTQPLDYEKKYNKLMPLFQANMKDYPNTVHAMGIRHLRYNKETAYVHKKELLGEIFVIRPEESLGIGRICHDPEELERVYQIGREVATKQLPALREYLELD